MTGLADSSVPGVWARLAVMGQEFCQYQLGCDDQRRVDRLAEGRDAIMPLIEPIGQGDPVEGVGEERLS